MKRTIWASSMVAGIIGTVLLTAHAQQPAAKPPMLPPINPALARLDITIPSLNGPGFSIAYGSEADLLVAACESGTIQAFKKNIIADFKKGPAEPEVWKGHQGPVRAIAWNGGPVLVSAGADKKISFWKMPEGKVAQTAPADVRIRAVAMSSDGKVAASAGESNVVQLWEPATGKPTTKLTDKMDWTISLAFSADGKQMLSGEYAGVVRLWDAAAGKKIAELPAKQKGAPDPIPATSLAFAPDGKTAVLGTMDGPIQFVNLADGKILRTLVGHAGPVTGIVFHPSGTVMASCGKDRTVKLWNPTAVAPLKSLDGHTAWVEGITFIDQGTRLATVSADQTVRIWDLTEPPKKK